MDRQRIADGADRFAAYIEELTNVIGHADRAAPLRDYCTGLLAAEGRRSVEPMAAVTAPGRVSVQHQKLLHFIGEGKWSDEEVLAKVRELVVMASVFALLPSVSDSARNSAKIAISSAIFLFDPAACSACSACSICSCASGMVTPSG